MTLRPVKGGGPTMLTGNRWCVRSSSYEVMYSCEQSYVESIASTSSLVTESWRNGSRQS